ncbi:SDR family oxidoreductase [Nonomuraea sp. NPDC050536]|uniref:SDR family oxidoreductase n=1 Tax=Nonomuraea sp. NPDC050536 TaxID=3364366 RepID=UPI0037C697FF
MELNDQRIVVLGGTSGIGLATAKLAASQGAEVVVVSSRPAGVARAVAEVPAAGHVADLTDPAAVEALFRELGAFDHLVYTAGEPLRLMPVADLDLASAKDFFTLRFFGALWAVHAALPYVRESITLTTGTAKDRPGPGWAVAAGICGAMESLTKALAVELAPIRVNAVAPGVVRSPLWSAMPDPEAFFEQVGGAIPAGRVGEVDDIARAYLSFVTQPFATGAVLTIDGGTVLV